jgi:hypothetical protein
MKSPVTVVAVTLTAAILVAASLLILTGTRNPVFAPRRIAQGGD